jgi:hypothetical protein
MQKFRKLRHLPVASLALFTLGAVVSHSFSTNYLASLVVVFMAVTMLWAVGKKTTPA